MSETKQDLDCDIAALERRIAAIDRAAHDAVMADKENREARYDLLEAYRGDLEDRLEELKAQREGR
jgi:hypothetical protein